ncbi:hypothetical protein HCN44_000908 [Aphidius gifuensis]|uniref:Uncharacterized protein n=1 Tax=Aphidius gifuensis TaxID=684658 RepID=A0A834XK07_APHGI|nr:hypothetical protein HCN44_000908 [Aphidius gifuensis]
MRNQKAIGSLLSEDEVEDILYRLEQLYADRIKGPSSGIIEETAIEVAPVYSTSYRLGLLEFLQEALSDFVEFEKDAEAYWTILVVSLIQVEDMHGMVMRIDQNNKEEQARIGDYLYGLSVHYAEQPSISVLNVAYDYLSQRKNPITSYESVIKMSAQNPNNTFYSDLVIKLEHHGVVEPRDTVLSWTLRKLDATWWFKPLKKMYYWGMSVLKAYHSLAVFMHTIKSIITFLFGISL